MSITAVRQPINESLPRTYQYALHRDNIKDPYIRLSMSPGGTANCQLNIVYNFSNPLSQVDGMCTKKDFIEFMKYLANSTRKLFLIDLNEEYSAQFEKLFSKKQIIMKSPYTSSNGSSMIIYIVNPLSE